MSRHEKAPTSYRIGTGLASHRARRIYADGQVVTLCGRSGITRNIRRMSEGAYPAQGKASCGTCRRIAVRLAISL